MHRDLGVKKDCAAGVAYRSQYLSVLELGADRRDGDYSPKTQKHRRESHSNVPPFRIDRYRVLSGNPGVQQPLRGEIAHELECSLWIGRRLTLAICHGGERSVTEGFQ